MGALFVRRNECLPTVGGVEEIAAEALQAKTV